MNKAGSDLKMKNKHRHSTGNKKLSLSKTASLYLNPYQIQQESEDTTARHLFKDESVQNIGMHTPLD